MRWPRVPCPVVIYVHVLYVLMAYAGTYVHDAAPTGRRRALRHIQEATRDVSLRCMADSVKS